MIGAIVLAAGLSSRMGTFKPLLPLGTETLIESTVQRLMEGGVERVVVVTGSRAEEVQRSLKGFRVQFAHNPSFEHTQMLDSAKIGLHLLGLCEETFVLPADVPMFSPILLKMLSQERLQQAADAAFPSLNGKNGHPLLLGADGVKAVLTYDGSGGIKGALNRLRTASCETDDLGCLLDADTREDYERLLLYRAACAPADYEIDKLHTQFGATDVIRRHCRAVAEVALELAQLPACAHLNKHLLAQTAQVHDAARAYPQHAARAAQALLELGYPRAAEMAAVHMELPRALWGVVSEASVLYLADKLVIEDQKVTLDERFSRAAQKCGQDKAKLAAVLSRKQAAQSVWNQLMR